MPLPCQNREQVANQVEPTKHLLENLNSEHPDVLLGHGIRPEDYHGGLVFRSAIESIRGSYIASSRTGREAMVADVLENLKQRNSIADYKYAGTRQRHDFAVTLSQVDRRFAAIEVKGGEGNSINISERPLWADEFAVWCHLDGAIVNQPAHGAHAIVGRLTNEMVNRRKQVDVLFIKDLLCGTSTRPCPKYPGKEADMGLRTAPDVFLFPQRIPTVDDPKPPGHDVVTLALPALILDLFGVAPVHYADHVFEVHVAIVEQPSGRLARMTTVVHKGQEVDHGIGRFSAQR